MVRALLASLARAFVAASVGRFRRGANRTESGGGCAPAADDYSWLSASGREVAPESARVMCPVYHGIARWNLEEYYKYLTYCGGAIGGLLAGGVAALLKYHSDPWSILLFGVFPAALWLQWNVSALCDTQYKRWLENLVLAAKCEYMMGLHGPVKPPPGAERDRAPWPRDHSFQVWSFYRDRTSACSPTSAEFVLAQMSKPGNLRKAGQRTLLWLTAAAGLFALLVVLNWAYLILVPAPH